MATGGGSKIGSSFDVAKLQSMTDSRKIRRAFISSNSGNANRDDELSYQTEFEEDQNASMNTSDLSQSTNKRKTKKITNYTNFDVNDVSKGNRVGLSRAEIILLDVNNHLRIIRNIFKRQEDKESLYEAKFINNGGNPSEYYGPGTSMGGSGGNGNKKEKPLHDEELYGPSIYSKDELKQFRELDKRNKIYASEAAGKFANSFQQELGLYTSKRSFISRVLREGRLVEETKRQDDLSDKIEQSWFDWTRKLKTVNLNPFAKKEASINIRKGTEKSYEDGQKSEIALTAVIPSLLTKILSAVSDDSNPEFYDWGTGTFRAADAIKRAEEKRRRDETARLGKLLKEAEGNLFFGKDQARIDELQERINANAEAIRTGEFTGTNAGLAGIISEDRKKSVEETSVIRGRFNIKYLLKLYPELTEKDIVEVTIRNADFPEEIVRELRELVVIRREEAFEKQYGGDGSFSDKFLARRKFNKQFENDVKDLDLNNQTFSKKKVKDTLSLFDDMIDETSDYNFLVELSYKLAVQQAFLRKREDIDRFEEITQKLNEKINKELKRRSDIKRPDPTKSKVLKEDFVLKKEGFGNTFNTKQKVSSIPSGNKIEMAVTSVIPELLSRIEGAVLGKEVDTAFDWETGTFRKKSDILKSATEARQKQRKELTKKRVKLNKSSRPFKPSQAEIGEEDLEETTSRDTFSEYQERSRSVKARRSLGIFGSVLFGAKNKVNSFMRKKTVETENVEAAKAEKRQKRVDESIMKMPVLLKENIKTTKEGLFKTNDTLEKTWSWEKAKAKRDALFSFIKGAFGTVKDVVGTAITALSSVASGLISGIMNAISNFGSKVMAALAAIGIAVGGARKLFKGGFGGIDAEDFEFGSDGKKKKKGKKAGKGGFLNSLKNFGKGAIGNVVKFGSKLVPGIGLASLGYGALDMFAGDDNEEEVTNFDMKSVSSKPNNISRMTHENAERTIQELEKSNAYQQQMVELQTNMLAILSNKEKNSNKDEETVFGKIKNSISNIFDGDVKSSNTTIRSGGSSFETYRNLVQAKAGLNNFRNISSNIRNSFSDFSALSNFKGMTVLEFANLFTDTKEEALALSSIIQTSSSNQLLNNTVIDEINIGLFEKSIASIFGNVDTFLKAGSDKIINRIALIPSTKMPTFNFFNPSSGVETRLLNKGDMLGGALSSNLSSLESMM
jgi:hypothetical protein